MICQVCGDPGTVRGTNRFGVRICGICDLPIRPKSNNELNKLQKIFRGREDQELRGHLRGAWADQQDVLV